ncbi:hypothetical protein ONZ45_g8302 [Pleurotus djamor]|nr:hypothetical protein ONZ45_g8302 [Pleurotus djamor]
MSNNRGRITTGNGASFGSGRAGDAHNSYNTSRYILYEALEVASSLITFSPYESHNTYEGDTFSGRITGGNIGGRNNSNTVYNNRPNPYTADSEAMEKELERLKAQLAEKKARAADRSKKEKLRKDLEAVQKELEVYEDAEEDVPKYL